MPRVPLSPPLSYLSLGDVVMHPNTACLKISPIPFPRLYRFLSYLSPCKSLCPLSFHHPPIPDRHFLGNHDFYVISIFSFPRVCTLFKWWNINPLSVTLPQSFYFKVQATLQMPRFPLPPPSFWRSRLLFGDLFELAVSFITTLPFSWCIKDVFPALVIVYRWYT